MDNNSKFCVELKVLVNSICRFLGQNSCDREGKNLTSIQLWIIHYLYENQGNDIFQRDLEVDFNIRRSTVSGIIQNMEKKGLISRESVERDARLKKITLTNDAMMLYQEMLAQITLIEKKMTENITEEEWTVFFRVLEKIKKNIQ
ncbi:transcriptional regulator SlyA [Anaerotignum neopropionicum]|uniref:Transcriptional regulator SlyA n=1 Tax=Anaerotignum neopropionicum TaxID=36847 RepID=A0A136WJQ1_9FIRM|nr:MarR family transcriptional regulator [Anaerotignum neopropionicum]KXL54569.1 transcriptional regulator SlyA [Anaerotignum neopropionicum]